jgi:hypothetical protein
MVLGVLESGHARRCMRDRPTLVNRIGVVSVAGDRSKESIVITRELKYYRYSMRTRSHGGNQGLIIQLIALLYYPLHGGNASALMIRE